jgi:probable HAF family extracellular repeat protein
MRSLAQLSSESSNICGGNWFLAKVRGSFGVAAFALPAALLLPTARVDAAYVATELAVLAEASARVVRRVNDSSEVVGSARLGTGRHQGFLLDGRVVPSGSLGSSDLRENDALLRSRGLLQPIEGRPGSDYSAAFGLNDLGDIAGAANTATGLRAFRSRRATASIELAPLSGHNSSGAFGINLRGDVVGYSSGPSGTQAVIWNPAGNVQALPVLSGANWSRAFAINNAGDVAGVSETAAGPRATLWTSGTVQDLGTLPGHAVSEALSINESGDVVGSSGNLQQRRAVLWIQGAAIQNLGTLPGGATSRALDNREGEVVGTSDSSNGERAFLWTSAGGMQDLNNLLTSRSGFVLTQAVSISRQGIILAIGQSDADSHDTHEVPLRIFILVPTP